MNVLIALLLALGLQMQSSPSAPVSPMTAPSCEYEDGSGDHDTPCHWDAGTAGVNDEGHSFWIMPDGTTFYDEPGVQDGQLTEDWEVICPKGWVRSWDDGKDGYRWSACM